MESEKQEGGRSEVAAASEISAGLDDVMVPFRWRPGEPPHPWNTEWFIAEMEWGDRVVLIALPKGQPYDYRTVDNTYVSRKKITRWAQFPDSEFVEAPDA